MNLLIRPDRNDHSASLISDVIATITARSRAWFPSDEKDRAALAAVRALSEFVFNLEDENDALKRDLAAR